MKVIQKNKFTVFVIVIYILLVFVGYKVYSSGNDQGLNYGHRLDGIEDVEITKEQYDTLIQKLKEEKVVKEASYHLSGKTLNVILKVALNTSLADAKKVGATVPTYLDEKQLKFYDVQVFIEEDVLAFEAGMSIDDLATLLSVPSSTITDTLKDLKVTVDKDYVLTFKDANNVAKKLEKTIKDRDEMHFPIIGYQKVGSKMTWTKDR